MQTLQPAPDPVPVHGLLLPVRLLHSLLFNGDEKYLCCQEEEDGQEKSAQGSKEHGKTHKPGQHAGIIKDRHETIQMFLELFRVPASLASKDACMMEHEPAPETIGQIRLFFAFLRENPGAANAMKNFEAFICVKAVQPLQHRQSVPT